MDETNYNYLNAKSFIKYIKNVISNSSDYRDIENALLNIENNVEFNNYSLVYFIKERIENLLQNLENNDSVINIENIKNYEDIKTLNGYGVEYRRIMGDIESNEDCFKEKIVILKVYTFSGLIYYDIQ
ncbi:hypothetical protein PIROE2DRAFT_2106 [Piromyces sp. E2]|nr:hypothetical protein PIROE2DRAFT_2106 [Piromyces sp. E2]|eukprot:OUM69910.1 hypothetical protein PIROE2DRAFT_2106 [Piromyces sp. E2]